MEVLVLQTINTYYDDYASLERFVSNHRKHLLGTNNRAVMVQIFSGIGDETHLLAISQQIRKLIPHAQVIGTTTSGEIMNGLVSGLKTVLAFSVFYHSNIKVGFAEKKGGDDYTLGQAIATRLYSDNARVLILFATGLNINANQLLKGVQSVNAGLPVAGGSAGDNHTYTQSFVCCNEQISACGVAGVVLEGDRLTVTCHSHLGWQPIGKEMTITRAEGSRVYTIDYLPAYQVYRKYLGINTDDKILNVNEFPLIICKQGVHVARAPFLRYEDDSMGFFGDFAEGEKVRFSFGHVDMILEKMDTLLQVIKQQSCESIFVYSCFARKCYLQESTQIETLPLQKIAPTAGFFTSGEFFHIDGSNQLLNNTMTTLTLSESRHNHHLQELLSMLKLEREFPQCNWGDLFSFAHFHDIGKVGISDQILFKPGPLTPEEIKEMQTHCEIGYRIARSSTELFPIADWILKHHEWWNGQGYPLGLKGEDIPLECRILAILDAYDEMTSERPYRKAMNHKYAIEEIKRCAGSQFDPVLADKIIGKLDKIKCNEDNPYSCGQKI